MDISNEIDFDSTTSKRIAAEEKFGKEWPVVYLLYNEKEVYVGETVDARIRMAQHYENSERRKLKYARIISGGEFNKSVILDLEAFLISHMSADSKFEKLQNGNAGHQQHNYYNQEYYESQFGELWKRLQNFKLAKEEIDKIENSNLFKYSPYKTLTSEQYTIATGIVSMLRQSIEKQEKGKTFIINGKPGTGKTVLGIYLMKLLASQTNYDLDSDDEHLIENLQAIHYALPKMKIGIVVSMVNLREILKTTFGATYGLNKGMVYGPSEIANSKEDFDILIVDEAHRLKTTRNAGAAIGKMQETNTELGLGKNTGNQLDWILKKSRFQILFYDKEQSIKRTDIDATVFSELEKKNTEVFDLETQIRCKKGGEQYIKYMREIFSENPPDAILDTGEYELKMFDDVYKMTEAIKKKDDDDSEVGLSRNLAGYAWPWVTKGKINPQNCEETRECIARGMYDIEIDGHKYIWNIKYDGWVNTTNAVNEIGCIHTIQGFDLNYAGVIIGNELRYDPVSKKLYVDKDNYYDINGKNKTEEKDLLKYILNIYFVLCTRGIYGTYIYACDDALRKYLKKYIKTVA
ncbi:DUF2075 domain-containing protein [Candidatus Saccharibacteria bacterium]|nr:DUF2075 domain-containing protein [Candidatus Saccharibacteria bacterium]